MRLSTFVTLVAFCALASAQPANVWASSAEVSFTDDFKGVPVKLPGVGTQAYPNPAKWAYTFWPGVTWPTSYGDGTNWLANNGECQDYVTPLLTSINGVAMPPQYAYNPFHIENDGLHIRASLLSSAQQKAYQIGGFQRFGSGMLMSLVPITYGHVTITAKMPSALGSWPAFWLLSQNHQWPPEIDIVEAMPWKQYTQQIHSGMIVPQGQTGGGSGWFNVGSTISAGFHAYELIWNASTMTVKFDNKQIWQEPTPASMNQPMYLIINLAVGGNWVFDELNVTPIDSFAASRLAQGSNMIQGDYPTDLVIKSVTITSP